MTYGTQIFTSTMTASQAFTEMAARQISLVPTFDGKYWTASVDEKGQNFSSKSRKVRQITAHSSTPIGAIRNLCVLLDGQAQQRAFEVEAPF